LSNPTPAQLYRVLYSAPSELFPAFVDSLQKKLERRSREEIKLVLPTMVQLLELIESLRWTLEGMYLCIVGGICLLLVFHVHIHRPLPHE
jgi:hypothetical protein